MPRGQTPGEGPAGHALREVAAVSKKPIDSCVSDETCECEPSPRRDQGIDETFHSLVSLHPGRRISDDSTKGRSGAVEGLFLRFPMKLFFVVLVLPRVAVLPTRGGVRFG